MSDFERQYAKEAMLSACDAKTDDDRQGLLELARGDTCPLRQMAKSLSGIVHN
jgi:hypothetical protein